MTAPADGDALNTSTSTGVLTTENVVVTPPVESVKTAEAVKTPEQIAADLKLGEGAKTPEQIATEKAAADKATADAAADKAVIDAAAQKLGKPADQLTEAEKDAARKAAKDAEGNKAKTGAPEKYEAFKLPEGVVADEAAMTEFQGVAKELNLSQDQAQRLIDLETKRMQGASEAQQKAWGDTLKSWADQTAADPELKGGVGYDKNVVNAKLAIDKIAGSDAPKLKQALDTTGTHSHPEFVRFFSRVGKLIADDVLHFGNAGASSSQDAAKVLFPSMK